MPTLPRTMLFLFVGARFVAAQPLAPPDSARKADVTRLQHAIAAALVSRDDAFLERTYAPDYTFVTSSGTVRTKAQVLEGRASGELRTTALTYDDLSVRLYGAVAVVTGRATVVTVDHGRVFNGQSRFVRVQVLKDGRWQVVHYQVSPIAIANPVSPSKARSSLDTARLDTTQPEGASKGRSPSSLRRIAVLFRGFNSEVSLAPGSPRMDTLRVELRRLGYSEGRDIVFISKPVSAEPDSLAVAARELVNDSVDLIVAGGSTEALFAEHATSHIPIVFWSAEPMAEGLVSSLERPGRNATGIVPAKSAEAERLEMLKLVAPGSGSIGVLYNPTYLPGVGVLRRARSAADSLGIQLNVVEAQSLPQMDSAFAAFKRNRVRAVLINNHGLFRINAAHLAALSLSYKLPVLSPYPEARDAGTLLSSVPDFVFWSRRAARYIDRILRGANPAELAVEESVPQHFTINLKTAAKLNIAIPEEVMRRVEVIR